MSPPLSKPGQKSKVKSQNEILKIKEKEIQEEK
jgi:hypothetical protein